MLFAEEDAPLIKAWIVRRLEGNSDADADVLADYVLALLRHDGNVETIRKLFEEEIPDFLREDAAAFTHDVLQAVQYRSYIPGAPPPPPTARQPHLPSSRAKSQAHPAPVSELTASSASLYNPAAPYTAPQAPDSLPRGGSRKRPYIDYDDGDVDIILTSQPSYGPPQKQQRRGGGFGQRGGRYEDSYGPKSSGGSHDFPAPPNPMPYMAPLPFAPLPIDANTIIENIKILQALLPSNIDLSSSAYSGTTNPSTRRKRRCRDYDTKGYCSRGNACNFQHGSQAAYVSPPISAPTDEYDPNNAALSLPPFATQQLDTTNSQSGTSTNRREPKKTRKIKGRVPFASNGPNHDKTKRSVVVQNIPSENFTEAQVRDYFTQFGGIEEVTMQNPNRVAIVKFDSWEAANTAWSSPKVIFDNRFVKVFWYKEPGDDVQSTESPLGKATNGHIEGARLPKEAASAEPEFDLEEFRRKQQEAQKIHNEKMKKRSEIEHERQQLEERQKDLRERQTETKRQLRAKLKAAGIEGDSLSPTEASANTGDKKSSVQTEALRAQLAALEQEANQLGLDPDDNHDEALYWFQQGRGRGRGYHGRGTFVPRAIRGSYGYRGRGGTVEARHAAYAAYSLDNRPKVVALSGVDFTIPENDEALRQYLFTVGEFKEVHSAPTITHVIFKDRKTAEKFMYGVSISNSIHGINGKIEPTWTNTAPQSANTGPNDEGVTASTLDDEQAIKEKMDAGTADVDGAGDGDGDFEEGEIDDSPGHDQGDMDYGEW